MMGHGVYGRHSLAQHSAGGRNELQPMTVAIETLRDAGVIAPITVVHTDIPTNDFSALFEAVEHDPNTYVRLDDVYTLAAGRSFYGRIFPPESLTLAWSAIAVHWISAYPYRSTARCATPSGSSRPPTGGSSSSRGPRSCGPVPRWSWSEGPTRTTAAAAPRR